MHRQLVRMHGFGLMNMILTQLSTEHDIILQVSGVLQRDSMLLIGMQALESMSKWKLQIRNKIEDSNIEEPVKALCADGDVRISALAKDVRRGLLASRS